MRDAWRRLLHRLVGHSWKYGIDMPEGENVVYCVRYCPVCGKLEQVDPWRP